jgi:transcriptional regulator GlxA family with amidase domain
VNIGIFIFDGAQELDFTGPWEVLNGWAREARGEREISVFTVARMHEPIRCANGLRVVPDYAWDDAPALDCSSFRAVGSGRWSRTTRSTPGWTERSARAR